MDYSLLLAAEIYSTESIKTKEGINLSEHNLSQFKADNHTSNLSMIKESPRQTDRQFSLNLDETTNTNR